MHADEALEIIRDGLVKRNWGLGLSIRYYDQNNNAIANDYISMNIYTPEQGKIEWEYENQEMKERWEHVSSGT